MTLTKIARVLSAIEHIQLDQDSLDRTSQIQQIEQSVYINPSEVSEIAIWKARLLADHLHIAIYPEPEK